MPDSFVITITGHPNPNAGGFNPDTLCSWSLSQGGELHEGDGFAREALDAARLAVEKHNALIKRDRDLRRKARADASKEEAA